MEVTSPDGTWFKFNATFSFVRNEPSSFWSTGIGVAWSPAVRSVTIWRRWINFLLSLVAVAKNKGDASACRRLLSVWPKMRQRAAEQVQCEFPLQRPVQSNPARLICIMNGGSAVPMICMSSYNPWTSPVSPLSVLPFKWISHAPCHTSPLNATFHLLASIRLSPPYSLTCPMKSTWNDPLCLNQIQLVAEILPLESPLHRFSSQQTINKFLAYFFLSSVDVRTTIWQARSLYAPG